MVRVADNAAWRHSYRYAMSSVLRPRGPNKAAVYWRRRAVVLLLVLAVPLALGLAFNGIGDAGTAAGAGPSPSPSPHATANSTSSPQPSTSSGAQSPGAQSSAAQTPAAQTPTAQTPAAQASEQPDVPACLDSETAVVASVDKDAYPAGANPQITLTIINESGQDCLRDIGSGANEIVITSGGHHVWSSDDCDPSQASNEQVLPVDAQAQVTVSWERKLSAPGCTGEAADAQAGTYEVVARNGSVVSEPVRFVLL